MTGDRYEIKLMNVKCDECMLEEMVCGLCNERRVMWRVIRMDR